MTQSQRGSDSEGDLNHSRYTSSGDSIRTIWGGMKGKISIIHSGWNPEVATRRILPQLDSEDTQLGRSLRDIGVNEEQLRAVIIKIAKYDNLLIEGDMIATDHVLSVLRLLYEPRYITVKNSWVFGLSPENVISNIDFKNTVSSHNLVLVCGPLGNLATDVLLREAHLSWLCDSRDRHVLHTHPKPDRDRCLTPTTFLKTHRIQCDYGVFIRCKNPRNEDRRMYFLMGSHSYGTQGAAALACNAVSAPELISVDVDPDIKSANVEYIAWVKVWREKETDVGEFTDPKLRYKIIYPDSSTWGEHTNPSAIRETQSILRTGLLENTLYLGAQPSKLLLYSLALTIVVFLICALLWKNYRLPITVAALVLAMVAAAKMFFFLIMPPVTARYKAWTKLMQVCSGHNLIPGKGISKIARERDEAQKDQEK